MPTISHPGTAELQVPGSSASVVIDVTHAHEAWKNIPYAEQCVRSAAMASLDRGFVGEVSVALESDAAMQALNLEWRGKDKPTNVLSFPSPQVAPPLPDMPRHLGDIALGLETLIAEADAQGKSLAHHLTHLVVHGMLHLQGMDHETDADAEAMEARERAILAGLGVPDPYAA
ncbi:rRNA maturation RNase YbeY [Pyruvatibacter sp.]|uniref:rRNA maturation RNase YbeY n=1 Tax=Pyruvatibacter sp. TaxID=1981328 RepID=UPI0032EF6205